MTASRGVAIGLLALAVGLLAYLMLGGSGERQYRLTFQTAGQLVTDNDVQIGGRRIGSVKKIELTDNNQAMITIAVEEPYAPLHAGTTAVQRMTSLSLRGTDHRAGPLERALRVLGRYIDRNVKARAAGLQTDLAEHGATLIMDDADAAHAGFLLPKFGMPFMPEDVGIPFLQRIAKFVAPTGVTADQMLASTALDDARRGSWLLPLAEKSLAKGDSHAAAGRPELAIEAYKAAWRYAVTGCERRTPR